MSHIAGKHPFPISILAFNGIHRKHVLFMNYNCYLFQLLEYLIRGLGLTHQT